MQDLTELYKEKYSDLTLYRVGTAEDNSLPVSVARVNVAPRTGEVMEYCLHRHEPFQINYIVSGTMYHEINNSLYELKEGHIFIIPPYVPHRFFPGKEEGGIYIELEFMPEFIFGTSGFQNTVDSSVFDFAFVEPFFVAEQDVKPRLFLTGKKRMKIEDIMEDIFEEYRSRTDSFLLAMKADILKLLVTLGRYFEEETAEGHTSIYKQQRGEMVRALRYIDEHLKEEITVDTVAGIACLSRSYFSSLFKSITGQTLVEYITDRRLDAARGMLLYSDMTVTEIGCHVGFNSINHFNRLFKKKYQHAPLQFRKMYREE